MRVFHFLQILGVTLALSGYSFWLSSARVDVTAPGRFQNESVVGIGLVHRAQAETLWKQPSTVFLDVRSPFDYEVGHIAGALNVPYEDFEKRLPEMQARLAKAQNIVVYCKSTNCAKSLWSAILLHQKGLTQAKIYPEGWYDWSEHRLPAARAEQ